MPPSNDIASSMAYKIILFINLIIDTVLDFPETFAPNKTARLPKSII